MELTNKILKGIDDKNISLAIFMDLSKAFDTLDHGILVKKLAHYSINGIALKWFTCYPSDHSQYVEIDGVPSSILSLSTGVPQGSILGPLLFLIHYRRKIWNIFYFSDFLHFCWVYMICLTLIVLSFPYEFDCFVFLAQSLWTLRRWLEPHE